MIESLKKIGYSEQESEVYLSLLKMWWAYVSTLASVMNVGRVWLYHTLDKLLDAWLVEQDMTKKQKYFIPAPPERILNIQKEHANIAESLVTQLQLIKNDHVQKPTFEYITQQGKVEDLIGEIFTVDDNAHWVQAYVQLSQWISGHLSQHLRKTILASLGNNMRIQCIFPYDEEVKAFLDDITIDWHDGLAHVSISPTEFPFQYDVFISNQVVGIFFQEQNEWRAIRMDSHAYADSQRAIFWLAWLGATSFVV